MSLITRTTFPLPMQYLGSKQRIASWILDEITESFPETSMLVDLMSGSGAIAHEANMRGWNLHANDIQPYSYCVLKSAFEAPRDGLVELIEWFDAGGVADHLLGGARAKAQQALLEEDAHFLQLSTGQFDWLAYSKFCARFSGNYADTTGDFDLFSTYYPNTYFGVRQCLEIDAIREKASQLSASTATHLVGALVSGLTFVSSTTTHLAQFLKPTSASTAQHLMIRRAKSVESEVVRRLRMLVEYPLPEKASTSNASFQDALRDLQISPAETIVYADPPYFKEHYSRYYHVLDTVALYDYPDLTFNDRLDSVTVGRYRANRIVSEFGLRSKVAQAFSEMFALASAKNLHLALSYASTSLLDIETIVSLAEAADYQVELKEIELKHSGQGQARAKTDVTEYLFLLRHG